MPTEFRAVIRRFSNVPKAVAFYRDGLGLTIGAEHEGRMIEFHSSNGAIFEVAEGTVTPVQPVPDRWQAHDTPFFEVDKVDELYERLLAHGGTPINPPFDVGVRRRLAYVGDPEGHIVGIGMNRVQS